MLHCHDEKAGFEYFFKLIDEFLQRDKTLDHEEQVSMIYEVVNNNA
jgi:hypothetical protein